MCENTDKMIGHTQRALESLGENKEKIEKLQTDLNDKQEHIQKLQKHLEFMKQVNSKKQVFLDHKEYILLNANNSIAGPREKAQKVYGVCLENMKKIADIDTNLPLLKKNLEINMRELQKDNQTHKEKVNELTYLLESVNFKKQEIKKSKKEREAMIEEENEKLRLEIRAIEEKEKMYTIEEDANILLEKNVEEIKDKLIILNENQDQLKKNIIQLDEDDLLLKKIHEEKNEILKKRSEKINEDILDLEDKYQTILAQQEEFSQTIKPLEEYNTKLKDNIEKTAKFWEDLLTDSDSAFKKIEAEMIEIRRDIEERNAKYAVLKEHKRHTLEELRNIDDFLAQNPLANLKDDLKEAGSELEKLNNFLEQSNTQYDSLITQNNNFDDELTTKIKWLETTKEKHVDLSKKFEEVASQETAQLSELRNKIVIEQKCLEKDNVTLTNAKTKIEMEVQNMEAKLHLIKNEIETLSTEHQTKTAEITELKSKDGNLRKEFKKTQLKKFELNRKIDSLKFAKISSGKGLNTLFKPSEVEQPTKKPELPPSILKKPEKKLSGKFIRPITPEPKRIKKAETKNPVNWDSDSSEDGSPITLKTLQKRNKKFF